MLGPLVDVSQFLKADAANLKPSRYACAIADIEGYEGNGETM